MPKVVKGRKVLPDSSNLVLTTVDVPDAVEGTCAAYLDQDGNQIMVVSAFGTMQFFREDGPIVTASLRSLADFIERNVV